MNAVKIKENVYWVGAIDWNLRNFHGYQTQRGSSYNAYLIIDEKITLIDAVKKPFAGELLQRIASVIPPERIDYVIVNHVEGDHAGALAEVRRACPQATFVMDEGARKGLLAHFHEEWPTQIVKTGDTLSTGNYTFSFLQMPMVHWPESMATYLAAEKILFPNDAFGQHYASTERFDDQVPYDLLMYEAAKYYANIVLPFGRQVQKALAATGDLAVEMICTSHGLIWRRHLAEIIAKYQQWSSNQTREQAVVVYDTMWHATEQMATALCDGFARGGIESKRLCLTVHNDHISDVMAALLEAKYIAIGSPTLNNNIMPTIAALLCYIKGLNPQNRVGIAFGSYGWSGQSVGLIADFMTEMGWPLMDKHRLPFTPTAEQLAAISAKTTAALPFA